MIEQAARWKIKAADAAMMAAALAVVDEGADSVLCLERRFVIAAGGLGESQLARLRQLGCAVSPERQYAPE